MPFTIDANGNMDLQNLQQRAAMESYGGQLPESYTPLTPEERQQFDYGAGFSPQQPAAAPPPAIDRPTAERLLGTYGNAVQFDPARNDWFRTDIQNGQMGRQYAADLQAAQGAVRQNYGREKVVYGSNVYQGYNNPYDNPGGIGQQSVGAYRAFNPASVGTSIKGRLAAGDTGYNVQQQTPRRPIGVPETFQYDARSRTWRQPVGQAARAAQTMGVTPNQALANSRAASNQALGLLFGGPRGSTTATAAPQIVNYPAGAPAPVDEWQVNEDGSLAPPGVEAPVDQENFSVAPYDSGYV